MQPRSYIFLRSLNKLHPHFYVTLSPLADQLLHHVTPSEQKTPSLLHHFTPLGSPTLTSFYPLWTNYPLTLTPFYPPWQPNSYLILPPLDKLPPHSYTILPPPLGSPILTSFYPLWTNYPLTLTPFYPPWQLNSIIIWPPQSYIVLAPIIDECKSWTHDFFTLSWCSFISRTPKLVQLLTIYIYEWKLLELPLWRNYPLTLTSFYPLRTNESQTLTSF